MSEDFAVLSLGSPEADLMLLGAREAPSEAVVERMARLVEKCSDADRFIRLCFCQKVYPLVLRALERVDPNVNGAFLAPCIEKLGAAYRRYWARSGRRVAIVARLAERILAAADVPLCFLKGLPLAQHYYLDPRMRTCVDVDILIPPSHREIAIAALLDGGFVGNDTELLQGARMEYEGQAELAHPRYRVLLDVNWLLTANVGIGKVESDTEVIWARALKVRGTLHRLSPEDEFFTIVRHVGQGHDFEDGFIRSCVDTTAILCACGDGFDWDHVCREAEKSESLRILRFYTYFYDEYYRDETMPVLGERCPSLRRVATDRECALFAKHILARIVRRKLVPKTTTQFISGNICFAGKLWALDRLHRLFRLLAVLPWPSRAEAILLTLESRSESVAWRRIRYYFNPLLPGLPGVIAGVAARVFVEVSRRIRALGPRRSRAADIAPD